MIKEQNNCLRIREALIFRAFIAIMAFQMSVPWQGKWQVKKRSFSVVLRGRDWSQVSHLPQQSVMNLKIPTENDTDTCITVCCDKQTENEEIKRT